MADPTLWSEDSMTAAQSSQGGALKTLSRSQSLGDLQVLHIKYPGEMGVIMVPASPGGYEDRGLRAGP